MELLLSPPVAFIIYILLVLTLFGFGKLLAPPAKQLASKSSIYAGGEQANTTKAAPGYRRFFIVALFFAVLHLAALVLATAGLAGGSIVIGTGFWMALIIYLAGISLVMVILLLS